MNLKDDFLPNISASLQVIGVIVLGYLLVPEEYSRFLAVIPRELFSLGGVIAMPFSHIDKAHLASNVIPIAVMMGLLSCLDKTPVLTASKISLLGSAMLWFMGRTDVSTVGASVLLFGLASYLVLVGIKQRKALNLVASAVVIGLYGAALLEGLIPQVGVSWDGHLFGLAAGVILASQWGGGK